METLGDARVGPRALLLWPVHVRAEDHIAAVDDHHDRQHQTADRIEKPIALVESNHLAAEYDQHCEHKINDRTDCCVSGRRERKKKAN